MAVTPEISSEQMASLVQDFLDKNRPADVELRVFAKGIRRDEEWWYVPVFPQPEEIRSTVYANALADAEERFRDQTGWNVLLVPTVAD